MNNSGVAIIFRDLLLGVIGILVLVLFMTFLQINPRSEQEEAKTDPPGNLIVAINWPPGNTDVDLWVDGPGELVPVGYSNKGGVLWNLLRDDLGTMPDVTGINYENAFTRGILPGDYTVNVHCYRCPVLPVPVQVEISSKPNGDGKLPMNIIATSTVELRSAGQERTALRFTMRADNTVDPDSMTTAFTPLRSSQK